MNYYTINFKKYQLEYYLEPGINLSLKDNLELYKTLCFINIESKKNLEYGIFKPNISQEEILNFFKDMIICVMKLDGVPIGFFYQYILQRTNTPIIHLGLILIYKNIGLDLMEFSYRYSILKIYQKYGKCDITNISAVPAIIGSVTYAYSNTWPSHNSTTRNPNKEYIKIANLLINNYAKKVFPNPDSLVFDKSRFVLKLNSRECGFEVNFFKLPKHNNMAVNIFCYTWIDYEQGEEIIQVGQINLSTYIKNIYKYLSLKFL